MIAMNATSALTNFIPLTQASARIGFKYMLQGMGETLATIRSDDGIVDMSDFLTNRRGTTALTQTGMQKVAEKAGILMEIIDNFTSGSIVRAAYRQNLNRGMSESEALHQADILAAEIMADRSKGAMPTLFEAQNPLIKAFTQFQLEVNNQMSEVFKDLPRYIGSAPKDELAAAIARLLFGYLLGAWLYNNCFEKWVGRRPAFDPMGIFLNTTETWTEDGIGAAGIQMIADVGQSIPFVGGLVGGGRLPVNGSFIDFGAVWEAATTTEDWDEKKRWKEIRDELSKLAYVIPPFGGAQISKSLKGAVAFHKGGSYSVNNDGEDILQYPIYKDDPYTLLGNALRTIVLGKNSLETAQDWAKSGYDSFSAEETAIYKDLLDIGIKDYTAYGEIDAIRHIEAPVGTAENEKAAIRRKMKKEYILQSNLSNEGKAILYFGMAATDTEIEKKDSLLGLGVSQGESLYFIHDLHETEKLKGVDKKIRIAEIFKAAPLTEDEKRFAVQFIMDTDRETESGGLTQYGKFLEAMETGLSVDKYMDIYSSDADVEKFIKMYDAGLNPETAVDIAVKIAQLEPLEEEETVSWYQKCDVILKSRMNDVDQVAALQVYSNESTGTKIQIGYENGLPPGALIYLKQILPQFDSDNNKSYTSQEVQTAIDAICGDDNVLYALTGTTPHGFTLTKDQKAMLWQLQKNSKKNPYNQAVGDRIYQQWKSASAKDEEEEPASSGQGIDLSSMLMGPK